MCTCLAENIYCVRVYRRMGNIRQSKIVAPRAAFIAVKLASVLFSLSPHTAESLLSS